MIRGGRASLAAALFAAAACSLQPVDVESRKEMISKLPTVAPAGATLPGTLLVLPPATNAAYDTTEMAYSNGPAELAYFARTEWAEKPSRMLHDLLVRTLERTQRFHAVVVPPYTGETAYALTTQLHELRQDFTAEPPTLRLALRAELRATGPGEHAVATHEFETRQPMAERSPSAGAVAANEAVAQLLGDVARFVAENAR